ncbi:MAG: 50S ribosomal protein L11 methyltransferase [Gemmatimonadaceae bacterium]
MSWTSLRIRSPQRRDEVIAVLFAAGAEGVHEDGHDLVTHFPDSVAVDDVVQAVEALVPDCDWVTTPTPDVDWSLAWRDRTRAFSVGAISVAPPWLAEGFETHRTVIIDPGMAFGTGDHASTRGALRLMQTSLNPGVVVADLGAGSAVLSIAAAKLGASSVFAIELDPDAIGNAQANIERNGVQDSVHLFEGDAATLLPLVAPVDLILANIISSVLVDLLATMARCLPSGGRAVLAGILAEERASILEVAEADGWSVVGEDQEEGWWSVALARP